MSQPKTITTRKALEAKLKLWRKAGFNMATCDGREFGFCDGFPIERYGKDTDGRFTRPAPRNAKHLRFVVCAEKYTPGGGPWGKSEYKSCRISKRLAFASKRAHDLQMAHAQAEFEQSKPRKLGEIQCNDIGMPGRDEVLVAMAALPCGSRWTIYAESKS
jgi:hypothetical protein